MTDRSYLPFRSAREYVDRGMAKWMGFFLSEHNSALSHMGDEVDFSGQMSDEEIFLYLGQVYLNKLEIALYTGQRKDPYLGKIYELKEDGLYLESGKKMIFIGFREIIRLTLLEEKNE